MVITLSNIGSHFNFNPIRLTVKSPLNALVETQFRQTFPAGIPTAPFHPLPHIRHNAFSIRNERQTDEFPLGLLSPAYKAGAHRNMVSLYQLFPFHRETKAP